jgi:hypothetical protein
MHDLMGDLLRIAVRWMMWSRRNLAIAAAVVLGCVALVGVFTSGSSRPSTLSPTVVIPATVVESGPGATLTEAPSLANPPSSSQTNSLTNSPSTAPSTDPAITQVADKFTHAWVNGGQSTAAWHAGVAPYATPRLITLLAKSDPSSVPANFVSGRPVIVGAADGHVAVRLPVNGGLWVQLVVVRSSDVWLVDQIDDVGAG